MADNGQAGPIVADPGQPIPYQPRSDGPTYFLRVPTVVDRSSYRHAIAAAGARYWGQVDLATAALAAIKRLMDGMEEQAQWLEWIEEYSAGIREVLDRRQSGPENDEDLLKALEMSPEVMMIFDAMASLDPILAKRIADNHVFAEKAGVVATRMFLVGWDGQGLGNLKRSIIGGVTDACLEHIASRDMVAIGNRISELMEPKQDKVGNLDSPSSGPTKAGRSRTGKTTHPTTPSSDATADA
jgi:hypothetical protein